MYALISARSFDSLEDEYGPPSFHSHEGDIHKALWQAARVQLDYLIVDIDFSDLLTAALHQYRIQRPDTRIIILAPDRESGDPLVAKLVSLGIYDIVSGTAESLNEGLIQSIKRPANYAQAARWLQLGQSPSVTSKKSRSTVREVLVQQRPLGLTTIAVAGAGPGAGVSHVSLAISAYLAQANNRVILAEWPLGSNNKADLVSQYTYLEYIGGKGECKQVHGVETSLLKIAGFNILLNARSLRSIESLFPVVAQGQYNYLVLDMGELTSDKMAEMDRAALAILVTSAAPYRWGRFLPLVDKQNYPLIFAGDISRWEIALNLANELELKNFANYFARFIDRVYAIPFMASPWEDPEPVRELVRPVLPTTLPKRTNSFQGLRKILGK